MTALFDLMGADLLTQQQREALGRWLPVEEVAVIEALLKGLLRDPEVHLTVVLDGEEASETALRTRDLDVLCEEIGESGMTELVVYRIPASGAPREKLGVVALIHSNGLDVIFDHTDSQWMETVVTPVHDAVNRVYEAMAREGTA